MYLCNLYNFSSKDNNRLMKCSIATHTQERNIHKCQYIYLLNEFVLVRHVIMKMAMPMSCWLTVHYAKNTLLYISLIHFGEGTCRLKGKNAMNLSEYFLG